MDYLDCHHSVGHIRLFEPLKDRAALPAAFLFQIVPLVDSSPSLAPIKAPACMWFPAQTPFPCKNHLIKFFITKWKRRKCQMTNKNLLQQIISNYIKLRCTTGANADVTFVAEKSPMETSKTIAKYAKRNRKSWKNVHFGNLWPVFWGAKAEIWIFSKHFFCSLILSQ